MDVRFENFLGRELVIPDDRLYDPTEGLWIREEENGKLAVGLTEPAVLMAGAIRQTELLVENGSKVSAGETVCLVLTSKLKYLAAPVSGTLTCPEDQMPSPTEIFENPYHAVLFRIVPDEDHTRQFLAAEAYARALKDSDGARNPGGHKGGVSPTCKAVYMALADQKIK